jgi:hypothetical protein
VDFVNLQEDTDVITADTSGLPHSKSTRTDHAYTSLQFLQHYILSRDLQEVFELVSRFIGYSPS